ncbi:MAG: hypothetical protein CM1200mP29_17720 [Verrucomicrobiota bacterium]|nr:MAG: hypothetical protein CM1200mP29_17720 [Verrucomicrobiota bacterium]
MTEPMQAPGLPSALGVDLHLCNHGGFEVLVCRPNRGQTHPYGLLIVSALLAVLGLFFLSTAQGLAMIFIFATLYGFGKTFFWPTMLGVVSEQCPKGGALTLNAIAGIGMLTVGIIGGPLIGKMQEDSSKNALEPATYEKISTENSYILGKYTAVDANKVAELGEEAAKETNEKIKVARQGALANVTIFPIVMLICYIALFLYFKGRGGYKTVEIGGDGGDGGEATH